MPYIKPEQRVAIYYDDGPGVYNLDMNNVKTAGDLNYVFTILATYYLDSQGGRYQQINDVLGALEGAKLEFYRRVAAPYEDKKIEENGDVY